jgi:hypothetical protein
MYYTYNNIQLKFVKVESFTQVNISKTSFYCNFLPFHQSVNVSLSSGAYDIVADFTKFVSLAVLWQHKLSTHEESLGYSFLNLALERFF